MDTKYDNAIMLLIHKYVCMYRTLTLYYLHVLIASSHQLELY